MPVIAAHKINLEDGNQAIYNALDSALTWEMDQARRSLGTNDNLIYDFERSMQGPALEMMLRGFRVDPMAREQAVHTLTESRRETETILYELLRAIGFTHTDKIIGSDKQLRELFYEKIKLTPIERTISGEKKRPMDRGTLEQLLTRNPYVEILIRLILLNRDQRKSLQVLETEIDPDWRWRCSYNIGGTSTGRWSSSKSPTGTGNNFQNISEEWRRVFIPDPGFKLYGVDKSQSEARDVGWFCGTVLGDWSYLDACESGDLHTYVTRMLYPDWDWTGNLKTDRVLAERRFYRFFTFRDASKRLGHATNYLGQPQEISKQTRIPLALVKEFQARYFAAFPCIPLMHAWVPAQLQRETYLVNSFGRRRDFFSRRDSHDTIKGAVAYLFQSATGDCVNLGLYRLWKRMGTRIQILSQLHDAVYFQALHPVTASAEKDLLREVLDCIEIPQTHPASGRTMKIPGEIVGGQNWAHRYRLLADGSKEDWNPRGLDGIKILT